MDKSAFAKSVFDGVRGEIRHRYEVREDALVYSAGRGDPKVVTIPWGDLARLKVGDAHALYFVRKNGQEFGVWLESADMERFLPQALEQWKLADRDTALKATFDYGSEEPSIGWIWLALTLGFPGLLATMLLSDGYHELKCNRMLEQGTVTQAQVVKIKKNRRGNFIWTLEFIASNGEKVMGTREAPMHNNAGHPTGSTSTSINAEPSDQTTIIYGADAPKKCWDLSMKTGELALNEKQRHFTVLMDLSFGWMFAIIAAVGAFFSIRRIRRRNPYREIVKQAGSP